MQKKLNIQKRSGKNPLLLELKKTNPALFKLFYSSPVAKALLFLKTNKYIEVNREFLKLFECKRKDILGKTPDELGLWASSAQRKKIMNTYNKDKKGSFNFDIKTLKGKIKNVIVASDTIGINGNEYMLGNIQDVTDIYKFELKFKENEDQYKLLFYNNPLPMWLFNFQSLKFIAVNEAAIKHYGYTKDEFLKMKLTDIRPGKEKQKFLKYHNDVITWNRQSKSYNAGVWKHVKKNGEIIDVEITRTPVIFEGHEAVLILANDITERLRSESTLIKRNREISELYRAGKELSKTLDPDKIYNSIYSIIRKIMNCDSMVISAYDSKTNRITCKAAWIGRKRVDVSEFPSIPANFSGNGIQSRVIQNGKPELILDFQKAVSKTKTKFYYKPDGSIKNTPNKQNLCERSAIVVPLKLKNKVIGVLQVKSLKVNSYTENDLKIVESLAVQMAISVSNADLYQQAQKEIKVRKETESELLKASVEISNIYEISKDLSGALSTDEINRKIFKIINSTFPECDIGISVLDEGKENIILNGLYINGKEVNTENFPPIKYDKTGKGLQSSVIASKQTRLIKNYKEYIKNNGARFFVKDSGKVVFKNDKSFTIAESSLIIPLIYEKETIGTLQLLNYSKKSLTENSQKILESLASHIAASMANAQLHIKIKKELYEKQQAELALKTKTEELQVLYDTQQVLSGSLDIERIYDKTYNIIASNIQCDSMIISSFNRSDNMIKILALWADRQKLDNTIFLPIPLAPEGRGIQSEVIRTGKPLLIDNYPSYYERTNTRLTYTDNKLKKNAKLKYFSAIIVPMKHHGDIIGVIQLLSYGKNTYDESKLKLLESLSGPIAAATFNASLYKQAKIEIEEKQKAREELALRNKEITLLYRAGRELLSTLVLEEIYEIFYRKVIEVVSCDSMIIAEYDRKHEKIICKAAWVENTKHDHTGFPPLNVGPDYKGTQAEAIVTGNSVIVNNFYDVIKNRKDKFLLDDSGNLLNSSESEQLVDDDTLISRSALYIPMKLGRNVIGVISVFSFKENAYSEYDLKILESISVNLSVAAANAELYNRSQKEIVERIKKEEELKQIRKNLEEAQRIAHIGSWVYDLRVNRLFNSAELYRILGYSDNPDSFEFEEAMSHIHTDDRMSTIEKIKKAVNEKSNYENEDRIVRPDGEIRDVKIVGEPMFDENGKYIGIQGTLQDITEVKRINEELVCSLTEKELMLKEIHHRVKNNLQIVSSLLRLQAEKITDKSAIEHFRLSEQRIKSMALIHQQLYKTKDLSRINFREYLYELCSYLIFANATSQRKITFTIEAEELYFGIDTALPCGLIINELFTNSIKHAFPNAENGSIIVKFRKEPVDKYLLVIQDNGIGAVNLDLDKTTSLGMELVNTLTQQLEGEISVHVDNGTEIKIIFKDQKQH